MLGINIDNAQLYFYLGSLITEILIKYAKFQNKAD